MYKIDEVVIGEIKFISKVHFICELENGWSGLCHVSEISDYYVTNINYFVSVGDKIPLKIIATDNEKKRAKLSYKMIMPMFLKNPFKYILEETKTGFRNLKNATIERIKND